MYIGGHVETVDTKDQSNAIVYGVLFVDTVDTKIRACNALNAMLTILLILVFVVPVQHCIQSTVRCENSTLLFIKWPIAPPRGKAI